MIGQEQDIPATIPEGRDFDGDGCKPEVKVFAKEPFSHIELQVSCSGCNQPGLHGDFSDPAQTAKGLVLKGPDQFGLSLRGEAVDPFQKDGPLPRHLQKAVFARFGIRESPWLISEEFRLQKLGGNGRTIDLHEGLIPSGRVKVDHAGEEPFAHPRLPPDQDHIHIHLAYPAGELDGGLEVGAFADQPVEGVPLAVEA